MATTRTPPLGLTRDQLAKFLDDHESIKAFENLFFVTESIAPDRVQSVEIQSAIADAKASQALSELQRIADEAALSAAIADSKAAMALSAFQNLADEVGASAAAAEARATLALQAVEDLRNAVEMVSMAPAKVPPKRTRFGQFYDTTVQNAALSNTAYAITLNTTNLSEGVRLRSPSTSEIEIDTEGVYDFQFSVQLDKTSGGTARFWIWFRLNGTDVQDSASEVQIQGNDAEIFSSANLFLDLKAGDYVQLMWAVSDTSVQLQYRPAAAPVPAIPSIILTVSNNIRSYPA